MGFGAVVGGGSNCDIMIQKIKEITCAVFGHQPHKYEYTDRSRIGNPTVSYQECSRCARRKSLNGVGWLERGDI